MFGVICINHHLGMDCCELYNAENLVLHVDINLFFSHS